MSTAARLLDLAAGRNLGVLTTLKRDGRPQLSAVNYTLEASDPAAPVVRVSVTDDRAKVRNARRDPRVSLFVSSDDGWSYAVLEGDAELSPVATGPTTRPSRRSSTSTGPPAAPSTRTGTTTAARWWPTSGWSSPCTSHTCTALPPAADPIPDPGSGSEHLGQPRGWFGTPRDGSARDTPRRARYGVCLVPNHPGVTVDDPACGGHGGDPASGGHGGEPPVQGLGPRTRLRSGRS